MTLHTAWLAPLQHIFELTLGCFWQGEWLVIYHGINQRVHVTLDFSDKDEIITCLSFSLVEYSENVPGSSVCSLLLMLCVLMPGGDDPLWLFLFCFSSWWYQASNSDKHLFHWSMRR